MLTLAIDCATEACSVALFDGSERIAGEYRILGRGHAEQLVPMIAALPGKGRAQRIAVATGPGSFTGVRVGLAAARALAFAWQAELVGYPTLALIAAMAQARAAPCPLAVVTTGGHGEWFVQRFDSKGLAVGEVASCKPGDAVGQHRRDLDRGQPGPGLCRSARHRRGAGAIARCQSLCRPARRNADQRCPPALWPRARCPVAHGGGMSAAGDDIDRIMAVMAAAFDPAFGEAWNRRQLEDALLVGNCHYLLIASDTRRARPGRSGGGLLPVAPWL